ncbi:MAG: sulfite exporter TauE/SafE family protein [Synergistaceae bacterium]|nr:sulfite exporter TauE/SafE family protein [Synergistaceae bacterium]
MIQFYEFLSLGRWELSPVSWGIFCLAVFIVGFSKTGLPGATIISVPLAAAVFPPKISVGLMLPVYIIADILSVWNYWRYAKRGYCLPYLLFVGLGVWSASFVAEAVDDKTFGVVIGWTVALLVLLNMATDFAQKRRKAAALLEPETSAASETRGETKHSPSLAMSASFGTASGLVSALANAGAPIMALYMIIARLNKFQILGTTAVCAFFMNWLKVPLFLSLNMMSAETLKLDAAMIPVTAAGGLAGILFAKKLPQEAFKKLVLALAFAASVKLILT